MNSPARSAAIRRMPRRSARMTQKSDGPRVVLLILIGIMVAGGVLVYMNPKSETDAVSAEMVEPHPVQSGNWQDLKEPVFNPSVRLNKTQMENFQLVDVIPNNPEVEPYRLDLLGLYGLGLTKAQEQILFALVMSESLFYHLDPETGEILMSDKDCASIMQGCNDECLWAMWLEKTTNVWCGAKTFLWFWEQFNVDQNPYMLHYAIAGYKGVLSSFDSDGDGVEDSWVKDTATGLPYIDPELKFQIELAESYLVWVDKT